MTLFLTALIDLAAWLVATGLFLLTLATLAALIMTLAGRPKGAQCNVLSRFSRNFRTAIDEFGSMMP